MIALVGAATLAAGVILAAAYIFGGKPWRDAMGGNLGIAAFMLICAGFLAFAGVPRGSDCATGFAPQGSFDDC